MKSRSISSMKSWLPRRKSAVKVTPSGQAVRIQAAQKTALELLASRKPLEEVLTALVRSVEEHCQGTIASVLLLDDHGRLRHGAAPGLPDEYNARVDGLEIGPTVGSCGTAAYTGKRVIIEDITTNELTADYREVAAQFGLRAVWSQPIFSADEKVLGTFAMYYREPRRPDPPDEEFIEVAAQLASVAIEAKRAEQAVRDSETRMRQIIDLVPHMIFAKDKEGRFLLANKKVVEFYGMPLEEIIGKKHRSIHSGEHEISKIRSDDREVMESGQPKFSPEVNATDNEGNLHVFHSTKIPYKQPGSDEPAILGIAIDVTDRKHEEERKRASERRILRQTAGLIELAKCEQLCSSDFRVFARLATETAAHTLGVERVSVWLFNADRTILRCEDLYELSKNAHSSGVEMEAATYPHYFAALERGRRVAAHDAHNHPDTSEFSETYLTPLGITSMLDAPLRLGEELLGVVCHEHVGQLRQWAPDEQDFGSTVADLVSLALEAGKRLRAEQAFRSAQEELLRQQWNARHQAEAELESVKDSLVWQTRLATVGQIATTVARELRGPLTAIHNAAECMKQYVTDAPTPECAEYLAAVEQESIAAVGIIDNLTQISGVREPVKKTVTLASAVHDAIRAVPQAEGMQVTMEFEPESFEIEADPEMLRSLLVHLIRNSARATDGVGEIDITAEHRDGFDDITFHDDGPGVSPDIRGNVFEPLCTTKDGGTGLGLTICRQIVEQHGGEITLADTERDGATFRIRLPIRAQ